MWNHLIYPEYSPMGTDDESMLIDWISYKYPSFVACLTLDNLTTTAQNIPDTLCSILPEEYRNMAGFTHGNSLYFCGLSDSRHDTLAGIENIKDTVCKTLNMVCTAGIAFLKDNSLSGLKWAAQRAVVAQRRKLQEGYGKVYLYDESYIPTEFSFDFYRDIEEQLHSLVRSGDMAGVEEFLNESRKQLFTRRYLGLNHLRPLLQTQIILMSQELKSIAGKSEDISEVTENLLMQISSTYEYTSLRDTFEYSVRWFVFKSAELGSRHATKLVSSAESIIQKNISDSDLGLQMISQLTKSNPSYLSRIFKQQKDLGIVQYTNNLRIENAKRLLLDRTLNITDIAYDLGFSSLTHFERIFKQLTGSTPSQYRQSKNVENL